MLVVSQAFVASVFLGRLLEYGGRYTRQEEHKAYRGCTLLLALMCHVPAALPVLQAEVIAGQKP